jgi:hypothetical protein
MHTGRCGAGLTALRHRLRTLWTLYSITTSARASNVAGTERPEYLGGLKVDRKLEFGRCLNRKIVWFGASEDAVNVGGGLGILIS